MTSIRRGVATRLLVVAVACLASSCSFASVDPYPAARPAAERTVLPGDFGRVIALRQGDVLVVQPPMAAAEWQVMFDDSFLEFQGTPEARRTPGTAGWKFNVLRAGETSLTVTPVIRGGPNPPRFTVTFQIEP